MVRQQTLLEILKQKVESGELGYLGKELIFVSGFFAGFGSLMNKKIRHAEMLEYIRERQVDVCFATFSSSIERKYREETGSQSSTPLNFTMLFKVQDSKYAVHPHHFSYNGSWEVLEEEMKRDAQALAEMGFKINYQGHAPRGDVQF